MVGRRRRTITTILTLAAGAATLQVITSSEAARQQWERQGPVPVATRTLAPGDVIAEADYEMAEVPAQVVPDKAATSDGLAGRAVAETVLKGEVLAEPRVAPGELGPLAAMLAEDHRAVALPVAGPLPALERGDRVDLHSATDPYAEIWGSAGGGGPGLLVNGAEILEVGADSITVAVPSQAVPALAAAITQSAVVPALTGR